MGVAVFSVKQPPLLMKTARCDPSNSLKISAAVHDWMDSLVAAVLKFHSRPAWLLVWKLSLILQNVKGVKNIL